VYSPRTQRHVTENYYAYEKSSTDGTEGLSSWLKKLPKPVGLLACNDIRGQQVINACRESGIRIPEEVAVIGVDNDEIICRLSFPTLSSIQPDVDKIGHLAAELLSKQLKGKKVALTYRVPPLRIVERQSTDTLVADDPTVVEVARILRERISQGGDVPRICKSMRLSRQNLDKLFVKNLGRTVSGEVTRIRLQVIKSLLQNSDLALKVIANRSGFTSVTYLCRFFKRQTGKTPEEFRDL
jgi:LacI family transcriptional regulator